MPYFPLMYVKWRSCHNIVALEMVLFSPHAVLLACYQCLEVNHIKPISNKYY